MKSSTIDGPIQHGTLLPAVIAYPTDVPTAMPNACQRVLKLWAVLDIGMGSTDNA